MCDASASIFSRTVSAVEHSFAVVWARVVSLSCHSLLQSPHPIFSRHTCAYVYLPERHNVVTHEGVLPLFRMQQTPHSKRNRPLRAGAPMHGRLTAFPHSTRLPGMEQSAHIPRQPTRKESLLPLKCTGKRYACEHRRTIAHTPLKEKFITERESKTTTTKRKREAEEKKYKCAISAVQNPHLHTRNHHHSQHRQRKETTHVAQHTVHAVKASKKKNQ